MDWSNDMVIEFLQHLATEPIIWDPTNVNNKRKHLVADAWRRLSQSVSWECNVEDLKRKRDSLMAYYRIHLNKMKKFKESGFGEEKEYKTSWFAFDTMNSFLGSVYDCSKTNSTETEVKLEISEDPLLEIHSPDSGSVESEGNEIYLQPKIKKRRTREETKSACSEEIKINECKLYGELLAQKLMKLEENDRLLLMNKIDNLVFQTTLSCKTNGNLQ